MVIRGYVGGYTVLCLVIEGYRLLYVFITALWEVCM